MSVQTKMEDVNTTALIQMALTIVHVLLDTGYTGKDSVQVNTLCVSKSTSFSLVFAHIDIDECSEGTSGCNQICSNTLGSYTCSCQDGYELDIDNHTCIDIDECIDDNGGCDHTCVNTNGSYYCLCNDSYVLNYDRHRCDG